MLGKWAIPVFASILVIGLLYSVDTQTVDAHSVCVVGLSGCDDSNPCTSDSCASAFSTSPFHVGNHCKFLPIIATCDDANACTSSDVCSAGVCVGTPKNCDDTNVCTNDSCNPQTGLCANTAVPNGVNCDDPGDGICDLQDICEGGNCVDKIEPEGTVCGTPAFGVNQNCDGTGICVPSSAITCGLGTELNLTTLQCEANVCDPNVGDHDDDDDEDDDDDDEDEDD